METTQRGSQFSLVNFAVKKLSFLLVAFVLFLTFCWLKILRPVLILWPDNDNFHSLSGSSSQGFLQHAFKCQVLLLRCNVIKDCVWKEYFCGMSCLWVFVKVFWFLFLFFFGPRNWAQWLDGKYFWRLRRILMLKTYLEEKFVLKIRNIFEIIFLTLS